jgi:hypothetical protein
LIRNFVESLNIYIVLVCHVHADILCCCATGVLSQEAEQQNPSWWGTVTNGWNQAGNIILGSGTIAEKRDRLGDLFNTTQTQIARDVEKAEKEAEKKEAEAEKDAKKDAAKVDKDAEKAEKDAEKAAKEAAEGAEDAVDGKKGPADNKLAEAKANADEAIKKAQAGANRAIDNAKKAIDGFKKDHGIKHKARHLRKQQKTLRQEPDAEVKAELAEHPIAEMDADVAELPTEADVAVENTAVETTRKHKKKHEKVKAHAHGASKEPVVEKLTTNVFSIFRSKRLDNNVQQF